MPVFVGIPADFLYSLWLVLAMVGMGLSFAVAKRVSAARATKNATG